MSGLIYYIGCAETFRLKIGYTSGPPEKRLKALRTGTPTPIYLMAIHPGTPEDERRLHRQFAVDRVRGEWFQMSAELFDHICIVVWLATRIALENGETVPHWCKTGLQAMKEGLGPLPEDLEAVIAELEPA